MRRGLSILGLCLAAGGAEAKPCPKEVVVAPPTDASEAYQRVVADAAKRFDPIPGLLVKTRYPREGGSVVADDAARVALGKRWDQVLTDFPAEQGTFGPLIDAEKALLLDVMRVALDGFTTALDPATEARLQEIEDKARAVLARPDMSPEAKAQATALIEKVASIRTNTNSALEGLKKKWNDAHEAEMIAGYVRAYVNRADFPADKSALAGLVRTRLAHYEQLFGFKVMKAHCEAVGGFVYKPKMFAVSP
ncbi:MAG: hypothetical protein JNL79_30305 [Myxococcales bacterium]|nr:hypothetical protein [Myxococcales bacterium]